jgi:hypothetical protein
MAPEFEKFYNTIETRNDILVKRFQADNDEIITDAYGIHSYPRLILYQPGSVQVYKLYRGKRTAEDLTNWINDIIKVVPKVEKKEVKIDEAKLDTNIKIIKKEEEVDKLYLQELGEFKNDIKSLYEKLTSFEKALEEIKRANLLKSRIFYGILAIISLVIIYICLKKFIKL